MKISLFIWEMLRSYNLNGGFAWGNPKISAINGLLDIY